MRKPLAFILFTNFLLCCALQKCRKMGQTQKHKTAVNFLSTCDETDEGYEVADYEFGWLLTSMTKQNMCRNLTTSRSRISMVMLSGTRFAFIQYSSSLSRKHLLPPSSLRDPRKLKSMQVPSVWSVTSYGLPWCSESNRDTVVIEVIRVMYLAPRLDTRICSALLATSQPTDKIRICICFGVECNHKTDKNRLIWVP